MRAGTGQLRGPPPAPTASPGPAPSARDALAPRMPMAGGLIPSCSLCFRGPSEEAEVQRGSATWGDRGHLPS